MKEMETDFSHYSKAYNCISEDRLVKYHILMTSPCRELVVLPYYAMQSAASLFYPTLHILEVCLRNKIYCALRNFYSIRCKKIALPGSPEEWYLWMPQKIETLREVNSARMNAMTSITTRQVIPGDIISRLPFGVWVAFLRERVNNTDPLFFWTAVKNDIFPNTTKSKTDIFNEIKWAKSLRNRLFHHEPLWTGAGTCSLSKAKSTLTEKHERLLNIINWISQDVDYTFSTPRGFSYRNVFCVGIDRIFDALGQPLPDAPSGKQ